MSTIDRAAKPPPLLRPVRRILSPAEAADYLGYNGPSASFYSRIKALGVSPLWPGGFDRQAIDGALDRAAGLEADPNYGDVDYN